VASAERTYVDPSTLHSMYVHDSRSQRVCAWRRRLGGSLRITRFGLVELVNSIELAVFRRFIEPSSANSALRDLETDVREGRLALVDALWRRALDLAADLSARHSAAIGTRTLDVIHVATARSLGATHFVTYDERQTALAKQVGLRVLAP
jgi:predicted nucleic acid-binding protein